MHKIKKHYFTNISKIKYSYLIS